jgi:hypothetical protein
VEKSQEATPVQRNKSTYDLAGEAGLEKGLQTGLDKGREVGRRLATLELIEAILETRFGELPETVLVNLRSLPTPELRNLGLRVQQAQGLVKLGL